RRGATRRAPRRRARRPRGTRARRSRRGAPRCRPACRASSAPPRRRPVPARCAARRARSARWPARTAGRDRCRPRRRTPGDASSSSPHGDRAPRHAVLLLHGSSLVRGPDRSRIAQPGRGGSGCATRSARLMLRPYNTDVEYVQRSTVAHTVLAETSAQVRDVIGSPEISRIFDDAMRRTLREAFVHPAGEEVFVLTGDIPAMWLRDSAAQVRPYLPLAARDEQLADLLVSLVRRQVSSILLDPYANAFNAGPTGAGHAGDDTDMHPAVWERKYEIDSLCFPLQLAHQVWRATGRTDHADADLARAADLVITTWRVEQDHAERSPYRFQRHDGPPTDTL